MMKRKLLSILLAVSALLVLTVAALAAETAPDGFNAGLTITESADKITVEIDNTDATNEILEAERPTLTLPCTFEAAYVVAPSGKVIVSVLADGEISFTVDRGGEYTIMSGSGPVDPEEPDPPVDPEEPDPPVEPENPYIPPTRPPKPVEKPDETEGPDEPDESQVPVEHPFTDVPAGIWYEEAVAYVHENCLMTGVGETDFAPQSTTTRAMIWTTLARLDGEDTSGGETWYTVGLEWAKAHSISDGTAPTASITREQLVTMLWRYAGEPEADNTALALFDDSADLSGYAVDAMAWAVENGIIDGVGETTLAPQSSANRAQVALILMRFCETLTK